MEAMIMGRLTGIIDMHIHSAPDIRQRKLDDLQLMEAAVERGVRAIVIKSHMVPTADRATYNTDDDTNSRCCHTRCEHAYTTEEHDNTNYHIHILL